MPRSVFATWAMTRRIEAYFGLPALVSVVLVLLYSLGPPGMRAFIVPGVIELPFLENRTIGAAHAISALLMLWIMILAGHTLVMARNGWIWACTVVIMIIEVFFALRWLDGHSVVSRVSSLWLPAAGDSGAHAQVMAGQGTLLSLVSIGVFSFLFFVILPLLYGSNRNTIATTLVPARWSIATVATLYGAFWLAYRLHGPGPVGAGGAPVLLDPGLPTLLLPLFFYLLLLYMARMQYRCWVRREADDWGRNRMAR